MRSSLPAAGLLAISAVALLLTITACTQEQQNKFGRGIQNWTGTDGVLDIYAGERLAMRFIQIDKISTGIGTSGTRMHFRTHVKSVGRTKALPWRDDPQSGRHRRPTRPDRTSSDRHWRAESRPPPQFLALHARTGAAP